MIGLVVEKMKPVAYIKRFAYKSSLSQVLTIRSCPPREEIPIQGSQYRKDAHLHIMDQEWMLCWYLPTKWATVTPVPAGAL